MADAEARPVRRPSRRWLAGLVAVLVVVALGVLLEVALDERFVPGPRWPGLGLVMLCTAPFALAFDAFVQAGIPLGERDRRRWFGIAARLAGLAALVVMFGLAASGWLLGASYAMREQEGTRAASVVAVGPYKTGRSATCERSLALDVDGHDRRVCADHLPGGPDARAGTPVMLHGRSSPFGLHVTGLRPR